jgi:sialic acid synthase SpsE
VIIAEIGTAHGGSIQKAEQLITAAAGAGADAVKFQWVYADEILHPDTGFVNLPGGNIPLYQRFRQLEVGKAFFEHVQDFARSQKVKFICSPFGLKSLTELISIHPDAIKIASPELNHFPMLKLLAETLKDIKEHNKKLLPVIVSSGVSKLCDIEKAFEIIGTEDVTLLHCITSYPAPETEYNLRVLKSLHQVFGVSTGVSDHSLDPVLVPALAVAMGSTVTEKHITLSKSTDGLDDPVALEPEQFSLMVHCVRQSEASIKRYGKAAGADKIISELSKEYGQEKIQTILGTGVKRLAPSERANYGFTNRSLHFMHSMKAGSIITADAIAVLRTEKNLLQGISPEFLETVIGTQLAKDVLAGNGVRWDDLLQTGETGGTL